MRIYLAARFGRQAELRGYRDVLVSLGHVVTSRWLEEISADDEQQGMVGGSVEASITMAARDVQDILNADMLIAFTEQPGSPYSRGGRHVEMGIAIGSGLRVRVCGPAENLFCFAPNVRVYATFQDLLRLASGNG